MISNSTEVNTLSNYNRLRNRTLEEKHPPQSPSDKKKTPRPTPQTNSPTNVIQAWLTPPIKPVSMRPSLQAKGIALSPDIETALMNLDDTDLNTRETSVFIESNDLSSTSKITERLRGVLTHLLTICAQKSDLTSNDFIIQVNTDDYDTGHSVSKERYATHWDFFEDVFEMHHREERVPDFKRFFAYSGEQFKPTEYLDLTLDDLAAIGLHPKHFNTFSEFKSAVNNIPDTQFTSCPARFQSLSSLNLHRAPQRNPSQLFIGFQPKAERDFYSSICCDLPKNNSTSNVKIEPFAGIFQCDA